ncbi:MAG: hypothetical protein IJ507_02785 [Clostridia bacterium]|nr:hypothetical protein [Clostridia bacterium]
MRKKIVIWLLLVVMTVVPLAAQAESFSLRGGVRFGMSPEEVIAVEASNGYHHDLTSKGDLLYKADTSYQLYYQKKNIGSLGSLPIMRFEYDFDLVNKEMYQFYYVFKGNDAYNYLVKSLAKKYGDTDRATTLATEKYEEIGADSHISHSRWTVESGDEIVVIDIWDNKYDVCFLVYQAFNGRQVLEEADSLDFGL